MAELEDPLAAQCPAVFEQALEAGQTGGAAGRSRYLQQGKRLQIQLAANEPNAFEGFYGPLWQIQRRTELLRFSGQSG